MSHAKAAHSTSIDFDKKIHGILQTGIKMASSFQRLHCSHFYQLLRRRRMGAASNAHSQAVRWLLRHLVCHHAAISKYSEKLKDSLEVTIGKGY